MLANGRPVGVRRTRSGSTVEIYELESGGARLYVPMIDRWNFHAARTAFRLTAAAAMPVPGERA